MTEFTTSTLENILQIGKDSIVDNLTALMPIVLPVAVSFAILWGVVYFFRGSARRK